MIWRVEPGYLQRVFKIKINHQSFTVFLALRMLDTPARSFYKVRWMHILLLVSKNISLRVRPCSFSGWLERCQEKGNFKWLVCRALEAGSKRESRRHDTERGAIILSKNTAWLSYWILGISLFTHAFIHIACVSLSPFHVACAPGEEDTHASTLTSSSLESSGESDQDRV